jgi:hypothetical protein
MSGKNRAFALAIATAALVGFAAPAASAASNPSGFNNDSIADVSGNQIPVQACNNDIPVNAGFLVGQVPLADIAALLGLAANSGNATVNDNRNCTQTPSQTDPTTVTTNSTSTDPSGGNNNHPSDCNKCGGGSSSWSASEDSTDANTSGFNNDSILNVSNNQIPVQACNNDIPINAGVGAVQVVGQDLSALGSLLGNTGNSTVNDNRNCTQTPTQDNPTNVSATSSSS